MQVTARRLFFQYALPCAGTLVSRGSVPQATIDALEHAVIHDTPLPPEEHIFQVAMAMLTLLAKRAHRDTIDETLIREYFLFQHDEVIDRRYAEMGDFDPQRCRTYPGIVQADGRIATEHGIQMYRTEFVPHLAAGDHVVVHWNWIVERIDQNLYEKLVKEKHKRMLTKEET